MLKLIANTSFKTVTFCVKPVRTMSKSVQGKLNGKVAVVTASTDGIGYAIAERLAKEGAKVVISSRKQKNVEAAVRTLKAKGLDVTGTVCHVSKQEDRKRLIEEAVKLGGIDILVSNAAVNPEIGGVLDASESSWDKLFDVNVKAPYLLSKETLPYLRKSKSGRIIYISSIAGYQPMMLLGAYSVTKTALLGLTKAAASQLAVDNITVNCVAPGIIKTKFSEFITETDGALELALSTVPLNRLGQPSDIGGITAFLASDDASYITGETIVVAGGMCSHL